MRLFGDDGDSISERECVRECQNALRNRPNTFVWFGKCHLIIDYVGRAQCTQTNLSIVTCGAGRTLICKQNSRWPAAIRNPNKQ